MKLKKRHTGGIKKWEISLAVGVLITIIVAFYANHEQQCLASTLIRLHVVANSDSERDQELKLKVRDRILVETESVLDESESIEVAESKLNEILPKIKSCAEEELKKNYAYYNVSAEICNEWFPKREYETFKLPAGYYKALKVDIGSAEGKNWWCVVFPPLCVAAASDNIHNAATGFGMTDDQAELISNNEINYELRFALVDFIGDIQGMFR